MTPSSTASSDSSLSCLAKAAAARHPIDLPVDEVTQDLRKDIMLSQRCLLFVRISLKLAKLCSITSFIHHKTKKIIIIKKKLYFSLLCL